MRLYISSLDGLVSCGYGVEGEDAKAVDPAEVIKKSWTYMSLHEQGYGGSKQHEVGVVHAWGNCFSDEIYQKEPSAFRGKHQKLHF